MKLSVILPTCRRIDSLRKMLDSLLETTQEYDIEIIALVDDDAESAKVVVEKGCVLDYSDTRRNVLMLWNRGLKMSVGDMIHPAMDDLVYHPHWLEYGLESHAEKLSGSGVIGFNDLAYNGNTQVATQFMFDRMYCKWFMGGVIAPPVYEYLCIDVEINEVAKSVNKFYWDKKAIVEHAHSAHGKRPYDAHDRWIVENELAKKRREDLRRTKSAWISCDMGTCDMNIIVAVRCYNEEKNIPRFMRGYDFADLIIVSDGGSTDNSVELLKTYSKVQLLNFDQRETLNDETWNPDAPHMNFVLDTAKSLNPDFLIFDDMDCVPTRALRENARNFLKNSSSPQVNAFRLYMWGDDQYFPYMNRSFDIDYVSLWAWKPNEIDIHADPNVHHGTMVGLSSEPTRLVPPHCLLHKSWHPDTIDAKVKRQNAVGIKMQHPLGFAGEPKPLPEWAVE